MGPSTSRTTSASAAKLRGLRIMLLSRSKSRKTRTTNNSFIRTGIVRAEIVERGGAGNGGVLNTGIGTNTRATSARRANNNNNNATTSTSSKSNKKVTVNKRVDREQREKRGIVKSNKLEMNGENFIEKLNEDQENEITQQPTIKEEREFKKDDVEQQQQQDDKKVVKAKKNEFLNSISILETTNTIATTSSTIASVVATGAITTTTAATTTTSSSPQPVKVFYDNRIKRKNVLALNEKVAAIREYEKMPVYKRIGRMFQCSPDQIKRIVQQKDSILEAWEQRTRRCQDAKTLEMKVVRVSMLGKAVFDWIRRMMYYKDFMITDGLIQKMALQFKSAMGLQNFFPHQDWCDKFRQTYKIFQHDSKLLSIGYTQCHSVQIKDIIKDVLSECTPDLMNAEATERDLAPSAAKQLKLIPNLLKHEHNSDENANEQKENITKINGITMGAFNAGHVNKSIQLTWQKTRYRQLQLPQWVSLPRGLGNMPQKVLFATPITTKNAAVNVQRSNANNTRSGSGNSPMTMTIIPLTTIAQPLGGTTNNGVGTQMPVASGSLIAANTKRQGRIVPAPMVEIKCEIKEERNDDEVESQLQQQQNVPNNVTVSVIPETNKTTSITNILAARQTLPVTPIAIKQELFSDEEVDDVENIKQSENIAEKQTITKLINNRTKTIKNTSRETTPIGGDDTMDSLDYENLPLSSLKKIIQSKSNKTITTTSKTNTTMLSTATTDTPVKITAAVAATTSTNFTQLNAGITPTITKPTNLPKLTLKSTPTLTLTPIENLRATSLPLPPMIALSQLACVPTQMQTATNNILNMNADNSATPRRHIALINHKAATHLPTTMTPLALQQLPPLIKAPTRSATPNSQLPLLALIPSSVSSNNFMHSIAVNNNNNNTSSTLLPIGYRLALKHNMRAESSTPPAQLSPIKTCTEARRYLKLLEDFALQGENFRLIELITRADEVLRELDGDDDVDID